MKVCVKRKLFVPAHLGYGERQMGAHIKPNSNLLIEIELMEVLTRINRRFEQAHRQSVTMLSREQRALTRYSLRCSVSHHMEAGL